MSHPTGTVTFLFSDIEEGIKLSQEFPVEYQAALEKYCLTLRNVVESNNGFVFKSVSGAFCCAFEKASQALIAAKEVILDSSEMNNSRMDLKTRIGIHTGIAEWSGSDYMGYITLARVSRILTSAYGGQIVLSNDTFKNIFEKDNLPQNKNIFFRDLGERRLKDVIEPIRLFQILSPGLQEEFPPLKTLDARSNNLPVQLTSFIGREEEIKVTKNHLKNNSLLTLTGPGGTGKTRLALQIAADVIDYFENGVWILELASLNSKDLLVQSALTAFGIKAQANLNSEDVLLDYLKDKELLIILDNCEHIIDAASEIAEKILCVNPKLRIISTSREVLRCKGEKVHAICPLNFPDPDSHESPERLSKYEAVRLFIERGLAVNSKFRLTDKNASAVAGICAQLDGIPLAIELASSRLNILSAEKIFDRLDNRFSLLTGGKRTALPRQQTLKAMIDWSYELLSEKEKLLFQKLSVFSGGWNLEAAEEICCDEDCEEFELIDLLLKLTDKSLVQLKEVSDSKRFYFLESIRHYAREKNSGNKNIRLKHFEYFLKMSDHNRLIDKGMNELEWVSSTETDISNVRSAIHWGLENNIEQTCEFISNISEFWNAKGLQKEGMDICRNILENKKEISNISRAKILYCTGLMGYELGEIEDSLRFAEESISLFRNENYRYGIMESLILKGVLSIIFHDNNFDTLEYYEEALAIAKDLKDNYKIANILYNMSFPIMDKGDAELSMKYRKDALYLHKESGRFYQAAITLVSLATSELRNGNFEEAKVYTDECLDISYKYNDKFLNSVNLYNLSCINSALKNYTEALEKANEAISISKECGYKTNLIPCYMNKGRILNNLKNFDEAKDNFKASIKIQMETGIDHFSSENFCGLCYSVFHQGDFEKALNLYFYGRLMFKDSNAIESYLKKNYGDFENQLIRSTGKDEFERRLNEKSSESLNKEAALEYALNA